MSGLNCRNSLERTSIHSTEVNNLVAKAFFGGFCKTEPKASPFSSPKKVNKMLTRKRKDNHIQ